MIFYVGDKPSTKNFDPNVAFVGTKSGQKLDSWHRKMFPFSQYMADNCTSNSFLHNMNVAKEFKFVVFALGNNAAKALDKLGVEYFKLPHPSPRNRLLNNKTYERECLKNAKKYFEARAATFVVAHDYLHNVNSHAINTGMMHVL